MGQQASLIHCSVRVVDNQCKVHEYEGDFLSTFYAVTDAMDRFEKPIFSIKVVAIGTCLFALPSLPKVA